ncbi:MAG TPA: hypothetical protein VF178_09730 [Gemmatimonadaceae bacterium]
MSGIVEWVSTEPTVRRVDSHDVTVRIVVPGPDYRRIKTSVELAESWLERQWPELRRCIAEGITQAWENQRTRAEAPHGAV